MGYRGEMDALQFAHRPRNAIQLTTGTLCHGLIATPQCGQRLSRIKEIFAGTRYATTFKKEPMRRPKTPATTTKKTTSSVMHQRSVW
jgi:hypothetical protein